jgi:WD40 repeat protein
MVWSIAFSPDGKVLALGDHLGAVNLYDTTSWKLVPKSIEHGHRNANLAVAVSPDGQTLLSSGADNTLRRWDLTTPSKHQLVHQSNSPYLAFHPTGTTFATGGANTFVTIWDAAGPRARPALSIRLTNLVYAPDGKIFAGQGTFFDKLVHLWDAQLGQEIHRFEFVGGGKAVTLSADGTLLAAGSQQGKVGVWNVTTGKEVTSWTDTQTTSLAFHPDGGSLAIGHHDGTITFRETSAWKKLRTIRAHVGPVSTLRFTPDGKTLLSSSTDGVIQLRDPEHERAREIIPVGPSGPAVTFVLDASGQFLFATGPTPVIYVHRLSANAVGAAPAADPDRPARP